MDRDKTKASAPAGIWRQWNQALAQKLNAGGQDLDSQARNLSQAAQAARERGDSVALWAALNALTKINLGLQRVAEARVLALEALALAGDLYGPASGQAGTVISDLIFIEALEGREHQALSLARQLEAIVLEQVSEGLDQAFSYNLTSLATFHAMRGDDERVERILWGAIQRGEELLTPGDEPDLVLFVYRNLGDFYRAQGRADKADQAQRSALALMERFGYPLRGHEPDGSGGGHSLH